MMKKLKYVKNETVEEFCNAALPVLSDAIADCAEEDDEFKTF